MYKNSRGHPVDLLIRQYAKVNRHEPHQLYVLDIYFDASVFLDERDLPTIVHNTGLTELQVRVWFNNNRARKKATRSSS